jgi:hypothetical protein
MENHVFRISGEKMKEIVSLYVEGCYKKSHIATMTGISRPTIERVLYGLTRGTRYFLGKDKDEDIIRLYSLNLTIGKTAKMSGVSSDTVQSVLKSNNITPLTGRRWRYLCGGTRDGWIKMRPEEIEFRIKKQGNKCAICGKDFMYTTPNADHKHGTKEVRGFLCRSCNIKLAGIEDAEFAKKAAEYLRANS